MHPECAATCQGHVTLEEQTSVQPRLYSPCYIVQAFTLALAITLSAGSRQASTVFSVQPFSGPKSIPLKTRIPVQRHISPDVLLMTPCLKLTLSQTYLFESDVG